METRLSVICTIRSKLGDCNEAVTHFHAPFFNSTFYLMGFVEKKAISSQKRAVVYVHPLMW